MKRLPLIVFALGALTFAGRLPAADKPNILFILSDDLGWTAPACFGNKDVPTPNLDRLAAQGMRFTQAYSDCQCSPTRAALLSGQYGARTGVFAVIHEMDPPKAFMRPPTANRAMQPNVATLAQTLRSAGYATGMSGKWHIADSYPAAPLLKRDGGKYFDKYGFDFCGAADESKQKEDKAVAAITDEILGFIEKNKDRPWFAYAAHFTTHTKLAAPKELIDKQVARGYKRSSNANGIFAERPTADYLAMLEHLDNNVGRMLQKLDDLKLTERTIVIFTSDNGGLSRVASCAPLREGKGSPYEGGIRVPMIVRWPGKVALGTVSDVPIHAVDYFPTFAEVAGATVAADHKLDGESLVPVWRQTGPLKRTALYWHMPTYTTQFGRAPCAIIRQGDWKLIHWFGDYLDTTGQTPGDKLYGKLVIGARTEMYNIHDDIGETKDLAATKPEKAAELKKALEAWWKDTGAAFPEKNPKFNADSWWLDEKITPRKGEDAG